MKESINVGIIWSVPLSSMIKQKNLPFCSKLLYLFIIRNIPSFLRTYTEFIIYLKIDSYYADAYISRGRSFLLTIY